MHFMSLTRIKQVIKVKLLSRLFSDLTTTLFQDSPYSPAATFQVSQVLLQKMSKMFPPPITSSNYFIFAFFFPRSNIVTK